MFFSIQIYQSLKKAIKEEASKRRKKEKESLNLALF
jgi:hypothetical protein